MKKIFMVLGVAAMAFAACTQSKDAGKPAIDLANFDNTVTAGEDFYQYACGGWMANNPLTPEYARYGIFDQLDKENQERLKSLIEELNATTQEPGSVGEKIQIMYALGLDTAKRNADGAAPVMEQMAAIKAVSNKDELSAMIAKLQTTGIRSYFGMYIGADEKNSMMNLLQFSQGGLSMGDRDYYLQNDENSVRIRNAYKVYMNKLFSLAGYSIQPILPNPCPKASNGAAISIILTILIFFQRQAIIKPINPPIIPPYTASPPCQKVIISLKLSIPP